MARRKVRQRISYVLPLANSPGGHRLGVNSLAVDCDQNILYSAGRDGVICAWDVADPTKSSIANTAPTAATATTFRDQAQAHTHWVNDILLAQSNQALVSASSDITVKVWRPHAQDGGQLPATIGMHNDYVKCLASPGVHSDWVASGGLDHKIRIWDLAGGGEKLQVDAGEDEESSKGSVYALSVRGNIMASGGPECTLRLWDPRTGKRITKFVGHTDNVRDILINETGDMVMTASSDQTVKIWSIAAGRCVNTLTMHNDSVWSLYSDHPQLGVFYSGDRSGLVAKTDVRGSTTMDEGVSVAVAQEHNGVNKVVVGGDFLWTATSSSSINRWKDVDTEAEIQTPESPRQNRLSSLATRPRGQSASNAVDVPATNGNPDAKRIPLASILKISNAIAPRLKDLEASTVHSGHTGRKPSEPFVDSEPENLEPIHSLPEETIEGQNGLIKHVMLEDRKRVLTLDTAGDVVLWDLLKCEPIQSFGKRHLEDVKPEVNTQERVENWCTVDTRTGKLAVVLEENYCFDAEMYADETGMNLEFREDQRINLGKWVLRYLFANLIDEEIKRDEVFRAELKNSQPQVPSGNSSIPRLGELPPNPLSSWKEEDSAITPKAVNGTFPTTPGLQIGVATPGATLTVGPSSTGAVDEELKKTISGQPRSSGDYFGSAPTTTDQSGEKATNTDKPANGDEAPLSPNEPEKDTKSTSLFGKKFKMNFPKKFGRTSTEVAQPAATEEKADESDNPSSEKGEEKVFDDNFSGVIQKIRSEYEEKLQKGLEEELRSDITPSLPGETPVMNLPPLTTIIIQEDRAESGGVQDLYRGTVKSAGQDASIIEQVGPAWLGELLLRNHPPEKEIQKISFILQPWQDTLPSIAGPDGNSRLNANRMLRAKKILGYVTDRIDPASSDAVFDPNRPRPEDYLELWCQNQLVPPNVTLATIKAFVWKGGGAGDVLLWYKGNGKKPELEERWKAEKDRVKAEEQGRAALSVGEGVEREASVPAAILGS